MFGQVSGFIIEPGSRALFRGFLMICTFTLAGLLRSLQVRYLKENTYLYEFSSSEYDWFRNIILLLRLQQRN